MAVRSVPTVDAIGAAEDGERRRGDGEPKVHATYTWDELGLDPELQALIEGRTYVYRTSDGEHFERSALPDGVDRDHRAGGGDRRRLHRLRRRLVGETMPRPGAHLDRRGRLRRRCRQPAARWR